MMIFKFSLLVVAVFCYFVNVHHINCEDPGHFFLKASKTVPRIGRNNKNNNNNNNDEFEKFFLKASKSVPRIGRKEPSDINMNIYPSDTQNNPYAREEIQEKKIRYPTWSDIADTFEYDPELLSNPQLLAELEEEMGDDPSIYEWDKIRLKRTTTPPVNVKNIYARTEK